MQAHGFVAFRVLAVMTRFERLRNRMRRVIVRIAHKVMYLNLGIRTLPRCRSGLLPFPPPLAPSVSCISPSLDMCVEDLFIAWFYDQVEIFTADDDSFALPPPTGPGDVSALDLFPPRIAAPNGITGS